MELIKRQLQNKGSEPPVLNEPNGPSPTSARVGPSPSTPDVLTKNEDDDDIEHVKYFSKEITKETKKKELQNALSQKDELKEALPQVLSVQVRELVEPILDGLVEQIEPALLYGMEFPDECESEIESQSEDEKEKKNSTIRTNEEALEVTKVMRRIFSENIEQTSITEQQLFFYYDSSMKEALEVVKVMRQKLSETIEQMSEEERLFYVYSIHSLGTALIQYSPELLEHSPEVVELAALLLQMGQFHQFLHEKRNSTTFHSIVHALSLSLAEGQIPLVSNPHVKEAIQIMSKRTYQNMDQLTEYFGFKTLFSSKKLFKSMLVEERRDGHKSSYKYNEVAFLFNTISDSDSDSNSTILPLPQDSCGKEVAGLQELFKKVDGKMVRNVHQTENDSSSPTSLLVLPWKGAENHTPINPILSNKKHLNSKEISDSKQKSKFKYVLPEKASPWKCNKPESIFSCSLHADQNVVQHAAIASAIAVHSLRAHQPMIYQTKNRSSDMLPIVRSDLCALSFHPSPPPDYCTSWCWKRRLNSIDHKNKVHCAKKISIPQLEVLDTECRETICHAVVSECTPEEASLLICVLRSRELNIFSQCDKYGNTPLHVAVLNNNKKAVEKLLEIYPAGVWIVNQDGETPVDLAYRMHHIHIIQCLLEQSIKDDPHSPETSQLWLSLLSRAKTDGWNDLQNILLELQVQWSQAIDPISNDMQTQTVDARVAAVSNNSHCNNLKNKQMEQDQRVVSANNNDAQCTHETSLPAHPVLHEDLTEYNNDQLKSPFVNDTDGNELHTSSPQDNVAIKQPHNSNDPTQPVATNTFTSQNLPHSSELQHEPPNMPKPKVIGALQLLPTFSKDPNPETQSLQHLQHDLLNNLFPSDEGSGYSEDDQHDDTKIKRRYSHFFRNRRKSRQTRFAFRSVGSGSSSCAYSSSDKNEIPNSQKQKDRRKVAMERIQCGRMSASDSEYKWRKVKRRTRQHKTVTRIETTPASSTDSSTRFKSLIQQSCGNFRMEKSMPEIVKAKEGLLSPSSIEIHSNETYSRETNSSETPFSASDSSHLYAYPTECNADSIPQGEKKSKLLSSSIETHSNETYSRETNGSETPFSASDSSHFYVHPSECNADSIPQGEKKSKLVLPSLPDSSHLKDKMEKLQTEEHEHIDVSVKTLRDISQSKSPTSAAHTSVFSSLKIQPLQSMSMQSEDGIWKCSSQTMITSLENIVFFPRQTCCLTMLRGYAMTTEKELDQKEIYSEENSSDSHFNFELIKQHSFAPLCITGLQKPCLKMCDGNVRISKLNITVNDLKWFQNLMKAALLSSIKHFCLLVTLTCSSNAYTHAVNDNQQLQEINPKKESEDQHLQFGNQVVSDLRVCLKTTLPCASYDKIFHYLSHYFANSTLSPTNRAKLTAVCGNNMPKNACDNLSNIKVVQLQPPHTFCMLEQHKFALTTYSGDMRFLPKKQKKRFELLLGYALCLQLMKQAAQNFVSSLSVHWTKALNVNISTPEAVQVNPIIADDLEKALVQKQSSSSNFEAALTAIIHDTDYNKIKELIPKSIHFLFGFLPWSGQHLSKFHERRCRIILKVARCNRSAIPADVKPNLDALAEVFRQRWEERPTVKHQLGRGGGGDKKSKLALKKSSKQLKNTHKDGVVSHGVDPNEAAESGVFLSLETKSKGAVPKPFSGYKYLPSAATASQPDKQTKQSQKTSVNTHGRKQSIKSSSEAKREEKSNMPSTLHFDNSNNPLEVIRGHFTTFKKCCQRHDIQQIVVVGTTYPASEALGPKRKHYSINDLRKEDRHTHFSFSSSLCTKKSSGTWKPLPLQLPLPQTDVLDKDGSTAAKKMSPEHLVNYPQRQDNKHSSQNLFKKEELEKDCSKTPEHSVFNPKKQYLKESPQKLSENDEVEKDTPVRHRTMPTRSAEIGGEMMMERSSAVEENEEVFRTTLASPPAEIVGGNLTNLKLENRTVNQPSIQPLSSSNRPSILPLSSNIQHDKWMHLLSDSQRQFHEERITIIAELIHAQDYPRILPLSYWGNPPTNLPPKYLIAYIFSTAVSYYKMGNNKESLVYFQASLDQAEVFERKGDVTLSCVYIGDIEFSQRKFIEAAKQYQTALKNYSRDSVARFFRMVLPSQSALCAKHGSALKNATKVVDAINAYELAIAKAESKKDKLSAHTSLGNLLQSLGENSRAITEYETSIELATALGDFVSLGWAYGNMGNAFLGLYQREKALHHLEKSLDLTVEHEPVPQAIGRAYNNLGTAHQALNELDKAEEFYDLALGQAIYGIDIPGQARVYGNIGNLLMLKKECDRAVPHYTEVLRLSQDRSTVSTAHHNRGCAYYEWAETKKETFLNEDKDVMPSIKPLLHGPQFEHWEREYSPPFIPENIKKYYTQATKDLDYVIRYHEESLDSIKGSAKGLSLSVSLFESNSRTFHRKQDCLVSTGKFEEALLAAEQSRARTLGELLLKRRGPQLEHQLRSPPSLEQLKLTVALQNSPVVYLSYTGARLLGWLFYPTPSQPSLNMFEVPLSDDEFDGKSFDYHLRYSLNEVLVEKSFEMYTPFKFELSQNDLVRKLYDLVAQPLMAMLQKLKKDAESQETPQKKTQKIIVIPDSYTNLLPLTCLLNKDGKFWGDDHYFQIMPSLLTMGILDQLPTVSVTVPVDNQQMLCVVGNPTIPTFTYNNEEWNLGKLPHATREAEWVSHILNCTPILHEQATKTAVMMRIMNAKVIHLATHGSASAGFLAFAGMTTSFSGPMESKNVLIYPEEIEKLNITPALVVLSSCDSGRGIVKADGIQGMARAFILAGAQAVLTTLWRVPDESACIFMQFFYQYLVDGLKGTEALHKSILSVRCFSKYSQYIHWSGYQLTGREIQFSINKSSSAADLTGRLGNHSIFPQLEIVKQLETTFLKNPRLPTDVQVLRGSSGVKPSEPLIDFIHSHHHHFRGGIFWINCKSTQLVDASVDYILKGMGIKEFSDVPDREGESTLVVFDFADKVPLQGSPISELLKKHNVHIVIISKHYFQSKSLLKDIDHSLLRGTNVIDIQPLSSVHTTQRIVHSVLKYHHLASSFDEQQVFSDLADFTTGSPAIIDVVSSLLNSHLEESPRCTTEAALQGFVKLVQLKELGFSEKPQSKVRTASPQTSHQQSMTPIREISKSMHDNIKTVQESENPWVTNTRYDSWQVITTLIEKCDLSTEEQLLLFCLSNFNCSPIPTFFVTEMATMISKASHKSHLASSLHCRLENMKLLKPYPKPIVFHPSLARLPSMPATMNTDFVYVPQFIAEAMWKDMMSDLDKAMVFSIIFKSFQNISRQSLSSIERSFLLGLCSLFVESCEQNYELVGKECFQEVYKFYFTLY